MSDAILPLDMAAEATRRRGLGAWLTTTDHKKIGILYLSTGFVFMLIGAGLAVLMRTQLIAPNMHFLTPEEYDQAFSMHGTTMIFLFAMPLIIGLANYLVPLQIGARDMAFPRLNALSYWLFAFSGILLYSSFAFGGALDTGWFSYAPLTEVAYSPHDGVSFWIVALVLLGASSIMGAINFIVTMLRFRAPGMGLWQMPMFSIATYINSYLILFAFPSLTAAIAMLYLDRRYGTMFYNSSKGGAPIIWQHLFWFFGHPEVYILILPPFGIVSEVVQVFARKQLFARSAMIISLVVILALSFMVWGHHMFTTGLPTVFNTAIAVTSMLIAVPTGVKIFNWLATMWGGSLRFKTPLLFCCGLIALFTIGGISGVMLASVPFDWQANDSYFVVGHLHNVLIAGTVFAGFAGVYYWYPKMTGRMLSDRLGRVQFILSIAGVSLMVLPMYGLGLLGMPRRMYTYSPNVGWNTLNLIVSIGGYLMATSFVVLVYNLVRSARAGEVAGDNPWGAWTLEWGTSSPPPPGNFRWLPPVRGPRPLWDLQHAGEPGGGAAPAGSSAAPGGAATVTTMASTGGGGGGGDHDGLTRAGSRRGVRGRRRRHSAHGRTRTVDDHPVFRRGRHSHHGRRPAHHPGRDRARGALPAGRLDGVPLEAATDRGSHRPALYVLRRRHVRLHRLRSGVLRRAHLRRHPPAHPQQQPWCGQPTAHHLPRHQHGNPHSSGVAAHYAQASFHKRRMAAFNGYLVLAVLLGATFLGGQLWTTRTQASGCPAGFWARPSTLTGFHGLHVLCGLAALIFLFIRATRERRRGVAEPSSGTMGMVDGATYYWHFVDAVWVVLFVRRLPALDLSR